MRCLCRGGIAGIDTALIIDVLAQTSAYGWLLSEMLRRNMTQPDYSASAVHAEITTKSLREKGCQTTQTHRLNSLERDGFRGIFTPAV